MKKKIDTDILKRQLTRYFSFRTIQGRNVLLTTSYLLILITFTILVVFQNKLVSDVGDRVIQTRNPITVMTSRINAGLDRVSAAQRGYFLTKDDSYKDARNSLWDTDILPALEKLEELGKQLTSQDRRSIDALGILLKEYKHGQDDLELYFEQHITDFAAIQEDVEAYDSLTLRLKLESFKKKTEVDEYIVEYLLTTISPLKAEIRDYLGPLSLQQRKAMLDDVKRINEDIESANSSIAFVTAFFAILAVGSSLLVIRTLNTSLQRPIDQLDRLAIGDLGDRIDETTDEMNDIILSSNQLRDNLDRASKFALNIGEGNFEATFKPASDHDMLGNALVQMRDRLKDVSDQDEKRNWITKGMAHFGEILRENQDLGKLSNSIVSELVNYLQANQGELYFIEEDEEQQKYLNLEATYAFERKRIIDKKIFIDGRFAEGLLGQSYLLGETIYLNDVPEGYTEITSGLGDATPRSVLIVPLKVNDEVEGVLEIASFKGIDQFEIEFVEKVAESIASTLRTAKNNQRTKELLLSSQEQRDHLRSQEEEMRQNYEELQATQEEMERRQKELESLRQNLQNEVKERTVELEKTLERFDLALQGTTEGIWDAALLTGELDESTTFWWSARFEELLGYEEGELNNDFESFINNIHPDDREEAVKLFKGLIADHLGIAPSTIDVRIRLKSGVYKWFHTSGAVRHNEKGIAQRFAGAVSDISSTVELVESQKLLSMREANLKAFLDVTNDFVLAMDQKMVITLANNAIKTTLRNRGVEIIEGETVILDILRPENREKYRDNTKRALEGQSFSDEMTLQLGAERRIMDTRYYPIHSDDGVIVGTTVMLHDITDRKQREIELEDSRRQLKAIFDTYDAEVYMKDLSGKYIMVDQTFLQNLNVDFDVIGKTDIEIYGQEKGEAIWELDEAISEQETEISFIETRDNGRKYKCVKFPMVNTAGKVYAICSIASEIEFDDSSVSGVDKVPVSVIFRNFAAPVEIVDTSGVWKNYFGEALDLNSFITESDEKRYKKAMQNIESAISEGKSYYETYTVTLNSGNKLLLLEKGNSVEREHDGKSIVVSALIDITPLRPNHDKNV
ncbi:PAS domain-containing protein [Flammeovirga kamogawensis]|uniref:histidine kinase n=1 Tax=Flammeovirga kamogawensis TaxID=373891 RepID=A0ABX8GU66_9BACT|nr:PAS domain-containing protein [Flammeovirga kamogawensis]MBB6462434.1 PAS domain S-box-containing protein [Flammeovirga kamogawensis]QWG06827.1 PAS domain-containing protein [Flammeovirga kamogawensis]TRX68651.1 PAS domain S-box protein [Flammeovirga kamogawensis]